MNTLLALSEVVIKELYRRKDFYVLFVLTAVITLVLAFANLFSDPRIVRYLKEVVLLLIWISALVIAITTTARQIPAERENRTIFPLLAKPARRDVEVLVYSPDKKWWRQAPLRKGMTTTKIYLGNENTKRGTEFPVVAMTCEKQLTQKTYLNLPDYRTKAEVTLTRS